MNERLYDIIANRSLQSRSTQPDSYPVAFRWRAKDCGEDGGKEATGTFQFQNGGQYGG